MDIRQELHKNHSNAQARKITDFIGNNPNRFKHLIQVFLEGPYRITQRAAWPLSKCVEKNPYLINPYLNTVLNQLKKQDVHDAVKRNVLRLLQFIEIPKRHHGKVITICYAYLLNKKESIAIHVFAITVLSRLVQHSPPLKNELKVIIEDYLPYASPAFLSRAKKILPMLN
jgi:hypothetical protein